MADTSVSSSPAVFKVGPDLTIAQVADAHRQLRELLDGRPEKGLMVDLADVSKVDAAGMQLLLALAQEARGTGLPLLWSTPPPAVLEAADTLGVVPMLGFSESSLEESVNGISDDS